MEKFKVELITSLWSGKALRKKVEKRLNELDNEGYEIVSVSFTTYATTNAYITIKKKILSQS